MPARLNQSPAPAADSLAVRVDARRRLVTVQSSALRRGRAGSRLQFLARAFACPHVQQIRINARTGTAEIGLSPTATPLTTAVADLARAIRGQADGQAIAVPRDCLDRACVTVERLGGRLVTWRVGSDRPDVLRLRHPRLRRDRVLARRLERMLLAIPGVKDVQLTSWTVDLVVRFDQQRLDTETLLTVLQHAVDEQAGTLLRASPLEMANTTTTLGVAALADFVVPALAPVSACLLVGNNLRTFAAVGGDIRRRRIGMPTLATAIILGTLATGQFLASGVMAWSYDFWKRRHRRDIEAERRLLLEDAIPLPTCSRLSQGDNRDRVQPRESFAVGDRLRLLTWDVVPVDGVVSAGGGVIDERCIRGIAGGRAVGVGDRLLAGTMLIGGEIELEATAAAADSRISRIAGILNEATLHRPGRMAPTVQAERFAEEMAGPALATAGLGLLAGDVATAVAIMRPDYASAEAVAVSFEDLDAVACGLAAGFLLSSAAAVDSLAAAETLVVVEHEALAARGIELVGVETSLTDEREAVRWAASLARHLACERRAALLEAARNRRCVLADPPVDSFGDADGVAITCRHGGRSFVLREAEPPVTGMPAALMLEIDSVPVGRFTFRESPRRRCRLVEQLQELKPMQTILHVVHPLAGEDGASGRFSDLGFDEIRGGVDPETVAATVRAIHQAGHRVAVAGPTAAIAAAAKIADVAIDLGRDGEPTASPAAVGMVSLSGRLDNLPELLAAASDRQARLAMARRLSVLPNVACVFGAFFLGFTSLVAAVVTNVGTLSIYNRSTKRLHANRRQHWLTHRPTLPVRLRFLQSVVAESATKLPASPAAPVEDVSSR